MWPYRAALSLFFLTFSLCFFGQPTSATIRYQVSLAQPEAHLFHITMTVPGVCDSLNMQLPAWNATYQVRDFAMRVQDMQASDEHHKALPAHKLDKLTWRVAGSGTITITYAILWDEPGPFAAQLNTTHAFLNLAMVLFYVPERRGEEIQLQLRDLPSNWDVATPLHAPAGASAPQTYEAKTYDQLVDSPIECGQFQEFDLPNITPVVHVVVHGSNWDKALLTDGLSRIVRSETSMMGGAPYPDYTFIFHIGVGGGGGMEHADGTAISVPNTNAAIGTAAHEFFHLWNVKRIRPQTLEPVDYTKEMPTRALWFAEGFTNTYGAYTLTRMDLWTPQQFYADLGNQITQLEARPARRWQSLDESSLDAWYEKYPLYNGPDFSVSYYNKGQIVGDMLDILIRDETDNHKSLDDVMRAMNENFAKRGRFYNDDADIEATAETVAGHSFKDFFARYVSGSDEIPFAEIFGKAGIRVTARETPEADLGMEIRNGGEGNIVVASVIAGGAAARAGIQEGDILESANGAFVPAGGAWRRWLSQLPPGQTVKWRVRRDGQVSDMDVVPDAKTGIVYKADEDPAANEKQKRIRDGMLHGTVN
jgi:predicted metalloprotease with PDZ domain